MAEDGRRPAGLAHWIEQRWPVKAVLRWALDEPVPGGASFAYVLGSLTLFLFVLQAVTGVWQMLYYAPSTDHAYNSVSYLRLDVPFGWLVHGLHYWGANAFMVVIALHILRVVVWGAYKRPRELTWLFGVALLLFSVGMYFTGALLPQDEAGFWAAEVGSSIAGTVPLVGSFIEAMMRGGGTMGQLTLARFFALHVAILPALAVLLIGGHLVAFRQQGSAGTWSAAAAGRTGRFWPDQVFRDLVAVALLLLVLVGLSAFSPPPFTGPADLLDVNYTPKPEWAFLSLYELLKFFPGALEPVATVGVPGVMGLVMVLLPFLDRHPERHPLRRPIVMGTGGLILTGGIALTIAGYLSGPVALSGASHAQAPHPMVASAALPPVSSAAVAKGRQVMNSVGCLGCHKMDGKGGTVGPDLSNEGSRGRSPAWLMAQLQDPRSHFPNTPMPSFASLSAGQRKAIVAFLLTRHGNGTPTAAAATHAAPPVTAGRLPAHGKQGLPGPAAYIVGNFDHGQRLFATYCTSCHGDQGKGGIPNPGAKGGHVPALNPIAASFVSTDPRVFARHIDRYIQHGSVPRGNHPGLRMPPFGDSNALTQQEIANIETYLLGLNGVRRARIMTPGMEPAHFFWLFLGALALVGLGLVGLWMRQRRRG